MGTPFKLYQVSLKYLYSLLASDNQSVIDKAFQYLEKDFQFWEPPELDTVIPTYQKHLHNLIVEGELYNPVSMFPVPREYKGDDSDGDLDVNPAMLIDVIEAIFST